MKLAEVFAKHERVAVCGAPHAGKTTLCQDIEDRPVIHTDDFREAKWDQVPLLVAAEMAGLESWVLEGTQAARVLRAGAIKADAIIWLPEPMDELTKGQKAMKKGVETVFLKWMRSLARPWPKVYTFTAAQVRRG